MKAVCYLNICLILSFINYISPEAPVVEVDYLPKKQWKMSKHDMADLKIDIEKELRSKILQMQMEWTKKQRMEDYIIHNQLINASLNMPTQMGLMNNFSNANMNYYLPETKFPKFLEKSNVIEINSEKENKEQETEKKVNFDLIVDKYISKNADKEIDLFTTNFRNYNSTIQDVDIKSIKTKITEIANQSNNFNDRDEYKNNNILSNS